MSKLRVLLLTHVLDSTGAPRVALDIFQALHDEVDLQIISLDGGNLEDQFRVLGPVTVLSRSIVPGAGRRMDALLPRGATLRLSGRLAARQARRFKPDLIYINSAAALPVARYARLPKAPIVLHAHETETALEAHRDKHHVLAPEQPIHYIAASDSVRRSLMERWQVADGNISVVHSFTSVRRIKELEDSASKGAVSKGAASKRTETPVIGGAGRISWCKGTDLWLLMAAELKNLLGDNAVRFCWVGMEDKVEDRQFRTMAKKLAIDHLIEFVPSTLTPLQHFTRFSVFAMTSWEESAPLVTLESMAMGKPVACFARSGGPPELIGTTGIVVDEFSPRKMADAIVELIASENRLKELGELARQRVEDNFTDAVQVPKVWKAIQDTASRVGTTDRR